MKLQLRTRVFYFHCIETAFQPSLGRAVQPLRALDSSIGITLPPIWTIWPSSFLPQEILGHVPNHPPLPSGWKGLCSSSQVKLGSTKGRREGRDLESAFQNLPCTHWSNQSWFCCLVELEEEDMWPSEKTSLRLLGKEIIVWALSSRGWRSSACFTGVCRAIWTLVRPE